MLCLRQRGCHACWFVLLERRNGHALEAWTCTARSWSVFHNDVSYRISCLIKHHRRVRTLPELHTYESSLAHCTGVRYGNTFQGIYTAVQTLPCLRFFGKVITHALCRSADRRLLRDSLQAVPGEPARCTAAAMCPHLCS